MFCFNEQTLYQALKLHLFAEYGDFIDIDFTNIIMGHQVLWLGSGKFIPVLYASSQCQWIKSEDHK